MPETNRQPWTAADLLDLEFFLNADADRPEEDLLERDQAIARDHLAPVLGADLRPEASMEDRSEGFRLWLESLKERVARESETAGAFSPGQSFENARRIVGALLVTASMAAGAFLVWGLLNFEWRYFNVLLFLAVTLLPQLFLLLLLVGGWVFRNLIGRSSTAGFVQALARTAVDWLSQKAWANPIGESAVRGWEGLRRRSYLTWPIARTTQAAGVAFNFGLILGFAGCLVVMDVRFFWESTPAVAAAESLQGIVSILSAPWSWALPGLVPTMEEIEGTKIALTGGERGLPESVDSAPAWAPFLIATILTWGLLPRLLLTLATGWMGRREVRNYSFNERAHRELWRRLTDSHVETRIEGPGDDAFFILWGGVAPDSEDLRKASLQNLRLNPVEVIAAGGADLSEDETAIERVSTKLRQVKTLSRIVLLAESWGLVPKDLGPFLRSIRGQVGDRLPIICFLVGHPNTETVFTAPESKEISVWEEFAAGLGDLNLTIRPFRTDRVESPNQQG